MMMNLMMLSLDSSIASNRRFAVAIQVLKREMDQLDTWLEVRRPVLEDKALGDSIDAVEEQLQKHDDFEKMVLAQEERFGAINRMTLVRPHPCCFDIGLGWFLLALTGSVTLAQHIICPAVCTVFLGSFILLPIRPLTRISRDAISLQ